jgi:acyl-CoA thioester hydrolase
MYPSLEEALQPFAVVVEIAVAWGDMDALQHVNNIMYFRYFETARIAYFERVGWLLPAAGATVGPILASTTCNFKFPLTFPDTVAVGARVTQIEADRVTIHSRAVSRRHSRIAAENDALVVAYSYAEKRRAALPDEVRARIEALEARGKL